MTACVCTGGAHVLYNKFNVTWSSPPENLTNDKIQTTTVSLLQVARVGGSHSARMNTVLSVSQVSDHITYKKLSVLSMTETICFSLLNRLCLEFTSLLSCIVNWKPFLVHQSFAGIIF